MKRHTAGLVLLLVGISTGTVQAQETGSARGGQLYAELCAGCHGVEGRGDGPTAERMGYSARDFSLGAFKCRSTPTGSAPTDEDLVRTLERGLTGTPMVSFSRRLEPGDAELLISHLKTLSPAFQNAAEVVGLPPAPELTEELVVEGRTVYGLLRCWSCHGVDGKGDGPAAEGLEDAWGNGLKVYDFTRRARYKCGGETEDLYRTLHTGMTGSPMPSFTEAFAFGSDQVGDVTTLASAIGAESAQTAAIWLATQPSATAIATLDATARQRLVERRTWALIAFLRSLETR